MGKKKMTMKGSMKLKTVVKNTSTEKCVFRWFIYSYNLLEPGRLYCQAFMNNGFNYAYKLIKTRGRLYLAFQCGYSKAHGKFFIANSNVIFSDIKTEEISDGLYVGDFPESDLLSDFYATNDLIIVAFRFMTNCSTSVQSNLADQIGPQTDFDELCFDIQSGYLDSKCSDFTFQLYNGSIKAHKSVLFTRSKFFGEFFTKDEDATEFSIPDITTKIMHSVLMYIYSGELNDIKTDSMVKILEVAYLLKVPSLKERCLDYFEETNSWEAIEGVQFFEYKIEDY